MIGETGMFPLDPKGWLLLVVAGILGSLKFKMPYRQAVIDQLF